MLPRFSWAAQTILQQTCTACAVQGYGQLQVDLRQLRFLQHIQQPCNSSNGTGPLPGPMHHTGRHLALHGPVCSSRLGRNSAHYAKLASQPGSSTYSLLPISPWQHLLQHYHHNLSCRPPQSFYATQVGCGAHSSLATDRRATRVLQSDYTTLSNSNWLQPKAEAPHKLPTAHCSSGIGRDQFFSSISAVRGSSADSARQSPCNSSILDIRLHSWEETTSHRLPEVFFPAYPAAVGHLRHFMSLASVSTSKAADSLHSRLHTCKYAKKRAGSSSTKSETLRSRSGEGKIVKADTEVTPFIRQLEKVVFEELGEHVELSKLWSDGTQSWAARVSSGNVNVFRSGLRNWLAFHGRDTALRAACKSPRTLALRPMRVQGFVQEICQGLEADQEWVWNVLLCSSYGINATPGVVTERLLHLQYLLDVDKQALRKLITRNFSVLNCSPSALRRKMLYISTLFNINVASVKQMAVCRPDILLVSNNTLRLKALVISRVVALSPEHKTQWFEAPSSSKAVAIMRSVQVLARPIFLFEVKAGNMLSAWGVTSIWTGLSASRWDQHCGDINKYREWWQGKVDSEPEVYGFVSKFGWQKKC